MIQNKYISATFKLILCLCGLVGILIYTGVFSQHLNLSVLRYYTLLSNALCVIYFAFAVAFVLSGREVPWRNLKAALTMGIVVTGLVYHLLLAGQSFSMSGDTAIANLLLHSIVPLLTVLDWLLFDKKGQYTLLSPIKWTIIPSLYFIYGTVYGFAGGELFYGGS